MNQNIELTDPRFPARLRMKRQAAGFTRYELAEKAGVSYRTVLDLEKGRRKRIQEKTLNLVAASLDCDRNELEIGKAIGEGVTSAQPGTNARHRYWVRLLLMVLLTIVSLLVISHWTIGKRAVVEEVDGAILVRDRLFGNLLWSTETVSPVCIYAESPWPGQRRIVYGTWGGGADAGRLYVRELASGKLVWGDLVSADNVRSVFGDTMASSGGFKVTSIKFGDITGNGIDELIVRFVHVMWYPSVVRVYDCSGEIIGSYYNCGIIDDEHIEDIDGDGKAELILAGTNNDRSYSGATVILLDDECCTGASVDSLSRSGKMTWCEMPDSSRLRVIFPAFEEPYMSLIDADRLHATDIQVYINPSGVLRISLGIGSYQLPLIVTLDSQLQPVDWQVSDVLLRRVASWPDSLAQSFINGYVSRWLQRQYRYGIGFY